MSDSAKRFKGQLQTVDGSLSGEPIVTTLFDYATNGMPIYIGEAKFGVKTDESRWFISTIEYDANANITAVKTASHKITTLASHVTVDVDSYPGFAAITATGGDLSLVSIGDKVYLQTGTNFVGGSQITQLLSSTQFLVALDGQVDETGTAITASDLIIGLEVPTLKEFTNRRWDKRSLYIYI
jgi:hypothetical protein